MQPDDERAAVLDEAQRLYQFCQHAETQCGIDEIAAALRKARAAGLEMRNG
jgi:hypothetical protein